MTRKRWPEINDQEEMSEVKNNQLILERCNE